MKRIVSLFIGFLVGIVFMQIPLNFGVYGFIVSFIQFFFTLMGAISVIVFGLLLLYHAFKSIGDKEI